jgi:hypothetical protein
MFIKVVEADFSLFNDWNNMLSCSMWPFGVFISS